MRISNSVNKQGISSMALKLALYWAIYIPQGGRQFVTYSVGMARLFGVCTLSSFFFKVIVMWEYEQVKDILVY
jgi:hypothetical protein